MRTHLALLVVSAFLMTLLLPAWSGAASGDALVLKPGAVPRAAAGATDLGVSPATYPVQVTIGLDLRNKGALESFLADASNPASPSFQRWLTQDAFNTLYGPTPAQEARVEQWLTGSGFTLAQTFPNRLLVVATGDNAAVQRAFGVQIHDVLLHGERKHTILQEPFFPADVASFTTGVLGLDDVAVMHSQLRLAAGHDDLGGGSCCSFSPGDLRNYYDVNPSFLGAGQTVVIAGVYAWIDQDVSAFDSQFGIPALPTGSAQVCTGTGGQGPGCAANPNVPVVGAQGAAGSSVEVSLDVESIHGAAPGAIVKNYMAQTQLVSSFATLYNKIVTDNPGHSVSTSWGSCESGAASDATSDNIFANGNAIGQSWFAASGDFGSDDCQAGNGSTSVDFPASSPHVIGAGGTGNDCSPAMTTTHPACSGWGAENGWSGSGGGVSTEFAKPSWQTGCSVPTAGKRNVPDVAAAADNAHPGTFIIFDQLVFTAGGTSEAAPLWAAWFGELNQKKGGTGLGLPGSRLYALCGTTVFHDVTSGSNGAFSAGTGYDRVTGLGSADVSNLLANY